MLVPAAEPHHQSGTVTEVEIYTDGACRGNPGPGGWAALLIAGKERKEVSGAEAATTNNRMELMAAIAGLGALKRRCAVQALHRFEVRAAGRHRMAAELEGARLAHGGARTCQESGFMGAARCGRGGARYQMALGQGTFRT